MTKIKICGLMSEEDARLVTELGVDYAGIVMFCPKSRRNTSPDDAKKIISALGSDVTAVAVVVSPTAAQIKEIENCGFDIIQIHGHLTSEVCHSIALPVFKAFNVSDISDIKNFADMDNIKGYVFDAAQPGSGKTFDWSVISDLPHSDKLTILAGGLDPVNVRDAIEFVKPDVVDVSSGVENESLTGKSRKKAEAFVTAVRSIDLDYLQK